MEWCLSGWRRNLSRRRGAGTLSRTFRNSTSHISVRSHQIHGIRPSPLCESMDIMHRSGGKSNFITLDIDAHSRTRNKYTAIFSRRDIRYIATLMLSQALVDFFHEGTMSVFVTYPLDVIRVRMAFQTKSPSLRGNSSPPTFTKAYKQIYNECTTPLHTSQSPHTSQPTVNTGHYFDRFPILKFYRGFSVTIAGMIPYAGVSFLSWGFLRSHFLPPNKTGHRPPTPVADLAIGAVSGVIAQTASYPFEIVRRRMQVGGLTRPDRWLRLGETVSAVWHSGGWRGFYVGLTIGYLKVVPMTAVSFAVWQGGKRLLNV